MCHLIFSTIWFVTHYSCVTHRFDPVSIRPSRDIRPYVTRLLSPYTGLVLARGTILSRYVSDQEIVVWRTIELLPTRLNLDIFSLCKKRKRIENWKIIYLTLIFLQSLWARESNLWLPEVTKIQLLLTMSIHNENNRWWELTCASVGMSHLHIAPHSPTNFSWQCVLSRS